MSRTRLTDRMTEVPLPFYAAAAFVLAIAFVTMTKVTLELVAPEPSVLSPYYAVAAAGALLLFGLLDRSWRGLVLSAVGSSLAAVALAAIGVSETSRWDIFLFALPLTIGGAAGLGIFGHGILHASPGVARVGFKVILIGYGVSPLLAVGGLKFMEIRNGVQANDPEIVGLALFALLSILVSILSIVMGLRKHRLEHAGVPPAEGRDRP